MSDVSTVVGIPEGAVELSAQQVWTARDGYSTVRIWEGTSDAIKALVNQWAVTGSGADQIRPTYDGKFGRLEVTIADDGGGGSSSGSVTADNAVWELLNNEMVKPVLNHPYFDTTDANVKAEYSNIGRTVNTTKEVVPATDQGKVLLACLKTGVSDVMVVAPVVRQSIIVSSRNIYNPTNDQAKQVFTIWNSTQLLAIIPTRYIWRVLLSADGGYKDFHWLNKAPQFREISKYRFQISVEYWGAESWIKYFFDYAPSGGLTGDDLRTGVAYP